MRRFAGLIFLLFAISNAQAQSPIQRANLEADIENIEQEIADLELFAEMKNAASYIPEQSRCKTYLELATGYRDELAALNAQFAGRADATYRERAEILLDYNNRAIEEYQSCFGSVAAEQYQKIRDAYVYPYDTFRGRYNQLSDWFSENTNLAARRGELQRELDALSTQLQAMEETGDFIGTISSTFREVTITRGNNTFATTQNTQIYVNDIISTGPRGRARIEINDRIETLNAGPTVLNIGSNSRVFMEHFNSRFQRLEQNRRENRGIVQLIRGTIRAATQNWGSGSAFSVRTGTSLCGIRGTEVLIGYNDQTGEMKHYLLHGTADLTNPSGRRDLRPMHVVETSSDGRISERPFNDNEYAAVGGIDGAAPVAPAQPEQLAVTWFRANYHLNRYLNAFVNEDYNVASTYFVGKEKDEIQALLNKPAELRAYLADKNLPLAWELGCLTCNAEDECAATIALNLSHTPDQISYYEWTIRPDGNLWKPARIAKLNQELFNNAASSCPVTN